jgi:hypothetical protein
LTNLLNYNLQRRKIAVNIVDCCDPHDRLSSLEPTAGYRNSDAARVAPGRLPDDKAQNPSPACFCI